MAVPTISYWQRFVRMASAFVVAITILAPSAITSANAASGDRTLYLYYTHTKETGKITFRRGGRYDKKGLAELNRFLRDWRRNEPTKMDPALFDLIWEVYQKSGAKGPIHVVSAYRAPQTNEMLRAKSRAVAKNSRHTQGMAMDFYIPGVSISKLRQIAMRKQVGGVGYYPTSGSPFVHLDTGNVRAWPRMTRAQLKKIFPKGKTLHVPTDGVPLSKDGYRFAKAQWTKCHSVPCSNRSVSQPSVRVASGNSNSKKTTSDWNPLGWFFGDDDEKQQATISVASNRAPPAPAAAPVPMTRPVPAGTLVANAPLPAARPRDLINTPALQPELLTRPPGTIAVASANDSAIPTPRALLSNPPVDGVLNPMLTAYAPAIVPEPNAQRAVQMLIERHNRAAAQQGAVAAMPAAGPELSEISLDAIRTASVNDQSTLDALSSLIENTWTAVSRAGDPANKLAPNLVAFVEARNAQLVAPDLEHITEIFADPSPMSSSRYAVIFEHDEADFNPATELGRYANKAQRNADPAWGLNTDRFIARAPLLVATR